MDTEAGVRHELIPWQAQSISWHSMGSGLEAQEAALPANSTTNLPEGILALTLGIDKNKGMHGWVKMNSVTTCSHNLLLLQTAEGRGCPLVLAEKRDVLQPCSGGMHLGAALCLGWGDSILWERAVTGGISGRVEGSANHTVTPSLGRDNSTCDQHFGIPLENLYLRLI